MKNIIKIAAISLAVSWINPVFSYDNQANTVAQTSTVSAGFLHSTEGTYGWNPVEGDISYDFFPDGRLHIEGAEGEATMREGSWTLKGSQLTLINSSLKTSKTVTVSKEGKDLLLNDKRYRRYRP